MRWLKEGGGSAAAGPVMPSSIPATGMAWWTVGEITIPCGGTHVGSLTELGQVQVTLACSEEGFTLTTRVTP